MFLPALCSSSTSRAQCQSVLPLLPNPFSCTFHGQNPDFVPVCFEDQPVCAANFLQERAVIIVLFFQSDADILCIHLAFQAVPPSNGFCNAFDARVLPNLLSVFFHESSSRLAGRPLQSSKHPGRPKSSDHQLPAFHNPKRFYPLHDPVCRAEGRVQHSFLCLASTNRSTCDPSRLP